MRNTKTGKVLVYNKDIINEMPWYEPIVEESQPEQLPDEAVLIEKPKRKTWKDAIAEKAQKLEGAANEEASLGETQSEQTEQASDSAAESQS